MPQQLINRVEQLQSEITNKTNKIAELVQLSIVTPTSKCPPADYTGSSWETDRIAYGQAKFIEAHKLRGEVTAHYGELQGMIAQYAECRSIWDDLLGQLGQQLGHPGTGYPAPGYPQPGIGFPQQGTENPSPSYPHMSYYNGSCLYGTRQLDIMGCLNKWSVITFSDGTKVQAYLRSIDFSYAGGYLVRSGLRSITCQDAVIQTTQQGQACLNKWVQVTLSNGVTLQLYLTYLDDSYAGGSFRTNELMALSGQISNVEC